ncbi:MULTISPECIES: histidine kinase [unclassified Streptomyces]|uniref:sensor histidine kinase n=1 Tax=unclassified Streptomyces TaxID=2593676 RepID=UPI000700AC02|nr:MULTISPECIES: histidine kinase [unclassified Streptomyces]KQX49630.1 histidine kinase [Streptomyces sp. Root1304]KRA79247.1 histidine kinase [Streptomyces sp. Root66D1]
MKSWSGRSGLAKVDLYTRVTAYMLLWSAVFVLGLLLLVRPIRHEAPLFLVVTAPLLNLANGVLCHRFLRRAMDAYLRPGTVLPARTVLPAAAAGAATAGAVLLEAATADVPELLPGMLGAALVPFLAGHCLTLRPRTVALHQALIVGVLLALVPLTGRDLAASVVGVATVAFVTGWLAVTVRVSLWVLGVVFELREARDVQARLAVAEERLRFGRDLHDILGRNLSVIALKSELAVQLARRERPEAVDQMTEVQRIARESQREVRDVVRGYREADLRVELEGARGVLGAAGIDCAVESPGPGLDLPGEVRSALGWVVRETTTNVLRHGDARRCAIVLSEEEDTVLLTVENDGLPRPSGPGLVSGAGGTPGAGGAPGSGLAGLRERLTAVGGTLEAGPGEAGTFLVTARIPLSRTPRTSPVEVDR